MTRPRYQIRRWDKRNTLLFWKYATPFIFMAWLIVFGMIASAVFNV